MKKILSTVLIICLSNFAMASGKLQNADFKTEAELVTAGATKAQLLNDSKVYVTANGINDKLDTAIASGLIGGTCSSLLSNGCFETGTGSWTNVNGVFSVTSVSGEFTEGTKAGKVVLTAQALNLSQTVTTPSGIQKQGSVGGAYKVPSTMADFQICSLVDSVEQTCVPSSSLILDNLYHSIEIPIVFGSTSAGIKFKTTSSYSATAFFDKTYIQQGLGLAGIQLDYQYSFRSSSTGVVSLENKDFVNGNGAITSTSVYTYTFNAGQFSSAPNCGCSVDRTAIGGNVICGIDSSSATQVVVETKIPGTGATTAGHQVWCQKSGNDYLASSSSVYSQAMAGAVNIQVSGTPANTSANNPVIFPTEANDITNSYNTATGQFTAPRAGLYLFSHTTVSTMSAGSKWQLYKGGSAFLLCGNQAGGNDYSTGSCATKLVAGDIITLVSDQAGTGYSSGSAMQITNVITEGYIAGLFAGYNPESNVVMASYWLSANFTSSTTIPINFDTKDYDSHNAVTTSPTAWKFTAPVSGTYQITTRADNNSTTAVFFELRKNGTKFIGHIGHTSGFDNGYGTGDSTSIKLSAGDFIDIRGGASIVVRGGVQNGDNTARIQITKTGPF